MTESEFTARSPRRIAVIMPHAVSIRDFVNSGKIVAGQRIT
jgi:hypothetical protein